MGICHSDFVCYPQTALFVMILHYGLVNYQALCLVWFGFKGAHKQQEPSLALPPAESQVLRSRLGLALDSERAHCDSVPLVFPFCLHLTLTCARRGEHRSMRTTVMMVPTTMSATQAQCNSSRDSANVIKLLFVPNSVICL